MTATVVRSKAWQIPEMSNLSAAVVCDTLAEVKEQTLLAGSHIKRLLAFTTKSTFSYRNAMKRLKQHFKNTTT